MQRLLNFARMTRAVLRSEPFVHSCFAIFDVLISATMKLVEIFAPEFDLAKTLNSGQVFHWQKIGDGFVGAIGDRRFG